MARSIIFDILAIDAASPTFTKVGLAAEGMGTKVKSTNATIARGFITAGVVAGALGIKAIKMAGDFDSAIVRLETTAGESHAALGQVSSGLLDMAGKVGFTGQELAKAMYTVESAGYHGADGLKVMAAASKGARVEGADLTTTVDAVSSLLVDYHLKGDQAARVTNILTAAVGHGKTTFEGLAAALPNVAAAGASAKISMAELASAIATMTMHGTDASKAGTYLRQVIGQLEAPSAKASKVMGQLGIDSNKLGLTLSSGSGHGLADAIKMVDDAITKHMTPAGLVALDQFKKSKDATTAYQKVLANLPGEYTTAFGALSHMVGGVKSLQGFLQLGGENLKTYKSNVQAVRVQVKMGGDTVEGFSQQQQTLNGKLNDAQGAASGLAIKVGQDLTPAAKGAVDMFTGLTSTLGKHDKIVSKVVIGLTGIAAVLLVVKATSAAYAGVQAALNIVMAANPVVLVVLALVALGAALVIAYKHSETFRNIVNGAWSAVGTAFRAVWNNFLAPVFQFYGKAIGVLLNTWAALLGLLGHVPGFGWAKDLADKLHTAADAASNLDLKLRNATKDRTANITIKYTQQQLMGAPSISKPRVGHNASGTPFWRGGLTWLGETGPELVNLPRGSAVYPAEESVRMVSGPGGSGASAGSGSGDLGTLTVVVRSESGEVLEQKLARLKRTRGGASLAFA